MRTNTDDDVCNLAIEVSDMIKSRLILMDIETEDDDVFVPIRQLLTKLVNPVEPENLN